MKKVLVYALAVIFLAGFTLVGNAQDKKPAEVKKEMKDTTKKKEAKTEKKEMKKEMGKKGKGMPHHKAPEKKGEAKKDTTKKK
jgi:Ni/Co efflux regulator RcnB